MPWRNTSGIGSGGRTPAVQETSRRDTMHHGWDKLRPWQTIAVSMAGEGPETGWLSIRVPPGDVAGAVKVDFQDR